MRRPRLSSALFSLIIGLPVVIGLPTASMASDTPHSVVVNPDPADWTPNILDGQVNTILQMGTKVVVGGTFTQVRRAGTSAILTRNYLFAFDMNTGAIDPNFVPQLNNSVLSLARGPDGTSVFVGGMFNEVNGATYRNLVRLRVSDGQAISAFRANTNARVQDLEMNQGWLYISGKFTQVKSLPRSGMARLSPQTGDVDPSFDLPFTDPLRGTLGVPEIAVSSDGTKLVAIGAFSKVAGLDRVQIAMLDVGTSPATVSSWQTTDYPLYVPGTTTTWCSGSFETYLRSVKISPDNQYFVVATTGAFRANRLCDTAARWELNARGPDQHPTWVDWSGGDTTWSVGITGTAIYVGGHFRWWNNPYRGDNAGPGAVPREGIAALDPLTGLPMSWDPGHERGVGIFTLPSTDNGLWVGSDTDHAGGEFHQKIAFHPVAGGSPVPPVVTYPLPGDLYNMDQSTGALNRRSYNLSTFGSATSVPGINWQNARGAFTLNGRLFYGMTDGRIYVRTFDGTSFGPASQVNLYGLEVQPSTSFLIPGTSTRVPAFTTDVAAMTGMFYDNGRIYYTVNKGSTQTTLNNKLYYRYYNPESGIIGANLFVASSYPTDAAVQWGNVRGMTLASGKLILAQTDGRLYSIDWGGTKPVGTAALISSATTWQSRGMFIYNPPAPDTTPPTVPGKPTGTSIGSAGIRISWTPSTDDSPPITYRIYRDGGGTPIGQTTDTTFTDTPLSPGSTHTYRVDAFDAVGNPSAMSAASDPITVASTIFADDFTSGDFSKWSGVTRLTIDNTQGSPSAPSARAQVSAQSAFANKDLDLPYQSACVSTNVNVSSQGGAALDLFRLRNASGGPISKVFLNASGVLIARSDFAATQQSSGVALGSGWHNVELCGVVGTSGAWDLYRDGVKILDAWTVNTGTDPIGRIQLGETASRTFTANFDHVRIDSEPGDVAEQDATPPTAPGKPSGQSLSAGSISLSWGGSFDDSPPITYRVYRDGGSTPVGQTTSTSFVDAGLAPGSTHTYQVDAVDAATDPILVGSEAIFADDFSSGNLSSWTSVTRITIDGSQGSAAAPSALGSPTAQSAFAYRDLGATYGSACFSLNVNVASLGGNAVDLFRLRSTGGGPIAKVFVNASGVLVARSDFAATQQSSGLALGSGWHNVELCGTVGASGTWDLYRDGVRIINAWSANTGTDPIGRVQIGDTANKTWTANFDDIRLDQTPG
jgi:chitodextrinase